MYNGFSFYYDSLMKDAQISKRADFIHSLFLRFNKVPTLMLDLGCGTGEFSNYFAKKGISVIGVDISPEMLSLAREKSEGTDILYLNQDMCELDLYGTVDGAICTLDSLNHLESKEKFTKALKKVSLFLEQGKLFIFDVNTPYKHREILGNNTFVKETEDVFCVWQNEFSKEDNRVDITLDIFKDNGGKYIRESESFSEIAFSTDYIKEALSTAGLQITAIFDGDTFSEANDQSQRLLFVTKKG